jgi:hypothetical protein
MDLKDLLNNPEQIKNLITVLQSLLPDEKTEIKEETSSINNEDIKPTNSIRTKNKRPPVQSGNKFEKMSEFNMHKDDKLIDEKLAKHPPVARTREYEPISVKCRVCGKTENINPALVHDSPSRYKCNNCSTNAG